jgi:hypothetical protein
MTDYFMISMPVLAAIFLSALYFQQDRQQYTKRVGMLIIVGLGSTMIAPLSSTCREK